ncbi:MAG: response regulator transcription factor [Anaeromicrobium sp.]|jgi:DNA-binding response OmpR family regulator|uniref:response regulator transcription factor n=1 Tax=Anaeromicrobium sp. TaxID=1929132 RepID=UPI0025FCDF52|nr:response regulator transcription factor [Anaeromicrobium sp.]MCT4592959.1 response regulator transcription factor [Anaeromicrobium sp.]
MKKILIIEDDYKLIEYITEYFTAYDFNVLGVDDFKDVMGKIEWEKPDLIILDINLPKFDGIYYLRLIRKKYNIPIIILSARSEESEQIRGIELGADDYITKPFSMGILFAKVNAIFRRNTGGIMPDQINASNLVLMEKSMKLKYREKLIELTKNEYLLLKSLMKSAGEVISREELLEAIWDNESFVDDNTLTVNITRTRKKLSKLGLNDIIITKRGVGYVFERNFN